MLKFVCIKYVYVFIVIIFASNILAMENNVKISPKIDFNELQKIGQEAKAEVKTFKVKRTRSTRWEKPTEKKQDQRENEEKSSDSEQSNKTQKLMNELLLNVLSNTKQSKSEPETEDEEELQEVALDDESIELEEFPGQSNNSSNEIPIDSDGQNMCECGFLPDNVKNFPNQVQQALVQCFGPIGACCFCCTPPKN